MRTYFICLIWVQLILIYGALNRIGDNIFALLNP